MLNFLSYVSSAMEEGIDRLNQRQDDKDRRDIANWLTLVDYDPQQSDYISRRQEGTGQWLLNSDEFQEWLNSSRRTLFCPGIPGAGKTVITSIVVDHLLTKFRNIANVGTVYLYCNYQRQHEQNLEDLLLSLLKQLAQKHPSVPVDVKNLYEFHKPKRTRPSFDEILKVLRSITGSYSRVFIIIDALDECHVSNKGFNRILSELFNLQVHAQVNLFTTSRFVPEITSQFEGCIWKEIRAKDDDVLRYINERISLLPQSRKSKHQDLQTAIRSEVLKAADGMYVHSSVRIWP
jgi:Cdc6-like AAA superfamily ATPase